MKSKTRWLIIVFIALLQVAMLLLVEIGMFGWVRQETDFVMTTKVREENTAFLANYMEQVGSNGALNDAEWLEHATEIAQHFVVPDHGFISINRIESGEMVFPFTGHQQIWTPFLSDGDSIEGTLSSHRRLEGVVQFGVEPHLVSVRQVKDRPFFVALHRHRDLMMQNAHNTLVYAHRVTFSLVLVVSLFAAVLIFTIQTRYKNRMQKINGELRRDVVQRAEELEQTKNAVIFGLAKLAESRDNDTGEHLDRIRSYVTLLAKDLKLESEAIDDAFIENLAVASSLHDIGKVGIPDSILLKPGRLSEKERGIMEMHAVIGGECLEAIQGRLGDNEFMSIATEVAYSHHERWDGTGYPYGLKEDEIPLAARIVSVADVYDALTSKRPYKKAMSHTESRAIIVAGSGSQFDPEVVAAFLRHEDEFEMISIQQQFIDDDQATSTFQKLAQAVADQTEEERESLTSR